MFHLFPIISNIIVIVSISDFTAIISIAIEPLQRFITINITGNSLY